MAKRLLIYTLVIEGVGAVLLYLHFRVHPVDTGDRSVWLAVFHAVSAYTGSGFDLMGEFQSFRGQASRPIFLIIMMVLIIPGDLGFMVVLDAIRQRRFLRMSLDTKVVLIMNTALWPIAALGFLVLEFQNVNTLGALSVPDRIVNSVFQAVTMRNAGFSTVSFAAISEVTLLFVIPFMIIGAASASMGGGVKVSSIATLLAAMRASLLGKNVVQMFGRTVAADRIYASLTIAILFVGWIILATPIVHLAHGWSGRIVPVLFDTVSAIGPIGLSTGVPPELHDLGKLFMCVLMFVGRLGPLTIALILIKRGSRQSLLRYPHGDLRIG